MKQINIFKQFLLLSAVMFAFSFSAMSQLSGTYTIGGASPDYATLSTAISALNSNGVNGPVTFVIRDGSYSGTSWIGVINNVSGASATNHITFQSQGGAKNSVTITDNSSSNYIFRFNNARYITVKNMTLVKNSSSYGIVFDFAATQSSNISVINCKIQANASTSSSTAMALVYANSHTGSNNTFTNCEFENGGSFVYWRGSNTSSTSNGMTFENNTFTASSGYYGIYTYYTRDMKFNNNTFTRTGSGTYYPYYVFYNNDNYEFKNNVMNVSSTSTMYFYQYYMNYINVNQSANVVITDNDINLTNTSGLTYCYTNYGYNCLQANNNINITSTTGGKNCYGMYYFYNSESHDNVYNLTSTSSGYTNFYDYAYGSNSEFYNNIYNSTNTTGYTYCYMGYNTTGGKFYDNEINIKSTSGIIYGLRCGYNAGEVYNNKFDFSASNSATVYGIYPYFMNAGKVYNNVVTLKSTGTIYNLYPYYCTGGTLMNNTIHSEGTSSSSYLLYNYNVNSGAFTLKNNIVTRKTASSNMVWEYRAGNTKSDYNLYYSPGSEKYQSNTNPSTTKTNLHEWRAATGNDRNTIFFQPPYANAASGDLHIDATSAGAWAINGRAEHDTTVKTDFDAVARPILVTDGVPDLGAYEVMPTSTPPNATAIPANPVANSTQYFLFAQDTVATIDWGSTVPSTYTMRQYTGTQALPMPAGVGRMYFYTAGTPSSFVHNYTPNIYYKDPWIGDIPNENEAVIARSSNGGAWEGYNYSNAQTIVTSNILASAAPLDSVGGYTGVQNGRIGIRCVEDPMNVKITNVTAFAADVDWSPVFNPIGYQVVLKNIKEAPSVSEWNSASLPTTNSIALGGLVEDTKYFVYIRSICGAKDTSGYTVDSFTTLITCHTPNVSVTGVSDARVVAYWNEIKTAIKYEYVLTNSAASPNFGTDLNKTSVLNTILDDNKEYYVYVRAHCSSIYEKSNWASTSFKTWKLGIGDVTGAGVNMNIYPNPVLNEMTVTVAAVTGVGTLTLMDVTGKVLKMESVTTSKVTMQAGDLPSGTYILQYVDDANRQQVKFNKQ